MRPPMTSPKPTLEEMLDGFCPRRHGLEAMAWQRVGREIHEEPTTMDASGGRDTSRDGPARV